MNTWQLYINLLGRLLLSFYFIKAGINNIRNWPRVLSLLRSKKIPLATLALMAVIVVEIVGGLAIIFNFYSLIAAFALILFTLSVNFLICNYWTMDGIQRKNVSFVFYANFAVIGALLLVISQ